jgi:hypothetical protein
MIFEQAGTFAAKLLRGKSPDCRLDRFDRYRIKSGGEMVVATGIEPVTSCV